MQMTTPQCSARLVSVVWIICGCVAIQCAIATAVDNSLFHSGDRIVFLGDSITHYGYYVSIFEAHLLACAELDDMEVINLGLPSETCNGLSEPAHPFPRPNVHDRIADNLSKTRPQVVVACYGMNDGIYYPFSVERFRTFQVGLTELVSKVREAGARIVLITPPPFDPLPMRLKGTLLPAEAREFSWEAVYENYDDVLRTYSDWVMSQRENVDAVIDVRSPLLGCLQEQRRRDEHFALSSDGVHIDKLGHRVLAKAVV